MLVGLRLVQGLAGAAGLVVSRAVARDLYSGRTLVVLTDKQPLITVGSAGGRSDVTQIRVRDLSE